MAPRWGRRRVARETQALRPEPEDRLAYASDFGQNFWLPLAQGPLESVCLLQGAFLDCPSLAHRQRLSSVLLSVHLQGLL